MSDEQAALPYVAFLRSIYKVIATLGAVVYLVSFFMYIRTPVHRVLSRLPM